MQQHRPKGLLNGWPFVGVAAVAILAAVMAAIAITPDPGEAAARRLGGHARARQGVGVGTQHGGSWQRSRGTAF